MFVIRIKWRSVLVRKTMTAELAMNAQMGTSVILIVMIVNASQTTQMAVLMCALRKAVNVLARKTMPTELAVFVMMNTMIILIVMIVDALQITP